MKGLPMDGGRRTRARALGVLLVLAVGAVAVVVARPSAASDHQDAPSLVGDPGADIGDVFAFVRPGGTTHLVLAMTVHPKATASTVFDEKVEYVFHVFGFDPQAGAVDPTLAEAQVGCRFLTVDSGTQKAICSVNGVSVERTIGEGDAGAETADVRVFAGLRAEPAFGDIAALKATVASGQSKLTDAGTNAFAGQNALAIVVELDIDRVLLSGGGSLGTRPLVAVSASTERVP